MTLLHADITETDAILAEDCRTVVFMAHTARSDCTFVAGIELPIAIDPKNFLEREWMFLASTLPWRRA